MSEHPAVPPASSPESTPESTPDRDAGQHTESRPEVPPAPEEMQSELDLGVVSTGSSVVDEALRRLDELPERPVADHPEVYDQVLDALAATMAADAEESPAHDPAPERA